MIVLNIDYQSLLPEYNGSCMISLKDSEPLYIPIGYILLKIHLPLSGRASPRFCYFFFLLEKDPLLWNQIIFYSDYRFHKNQCCCMPLSNIYHISHKQYAQLVCLLLPLLFNRLYDIRFYQISLTRWPFLRFVKTDIFDFLRID